LLVFLPCLELVSPAQVQSPVLVLPLLEERVVLLLLA
jgi:hypothetical protein